MTKNQQTYNVNSEAAWVVSVLEKTASKLGHKIPVSKLIETVEAEFGQQLGPGVGAEVAAQAWTALATFSDKSDTSKAINKLLHADDRSDPRTQLSRFYNRTIKDRVAELEQRVDKANEWIKATTYSGEPKLIDKSQYVLNYLINDDPILSGFQSERLIKNRGKRLTGLSHTASWEHSDPTNLALLINEPERVIGYATEGKHYPGTSSTRETLDKVADSAIYLMSAAPGAQALKAASNDDKTFGDMAIISLGLLAVSAAILLPPVKVATAAAGLSPAAAAKATGIFKAWSTAGLVAGGTLFSSKIRNDLGYYLFNPNPAPAEATNPITISELPSSPTLLNPNDNDIVVSYMANHLVRESRDRGWGFTLSPGKNTKLNDILTGEKRMTRIPAWAEESDKFYIPEILYLVDKKEGELGNTNYSFIMSDGTSTYRKSGTLSELSGGIAGEAEIQMIGPFDVPDYVFARGLGSVNLYYALSTDGTPISPSGATTISGYFSPQLSL